MNLYYQDEPVGPWMKNVRDYLEKTYPGRFCPPNRSGFHLQWMTERQDAVYVLREPRTVTLYVSGPEFHLYAADAAQFRAWGLEVEWNVEPVTWTQWLIRLYRPFRIDDETPPPGVSRLASHRAKDLKNLTYEERDALTPAERYDNWYDGPKLPDLLAEEYAPELTPARSDDCYAEQYVGVGFCTGACSSYTSRE
jgi:hypothetical protein